MLLGCLRALSDEAAVQVSWRRQGCSPPEGGHNPRDPPPSPHLPRDSPRDLPRRRRDKWEGLPFDVITTLLDPPYLFDLPYDDDDSKEAGVLQLGLGWPRVEGPLSHADWVGGFGLELCRPTCKYQRRQIVRRPFLEMPV